jgi:stage V sporulation protein G
MQITDTRFKLIDSRQAGGNRLRAFCTVTLDDEFVVRDLRIIEGPSACFVAMPSRKLRDRCTRCGGKNHLRAAFCNECGQRLDENRAPKDREGRVKLYSDIAHPLNARCRKWMEQQILDAFKEEMDRAQSPDYSPDRYPGDSDDEGDDLHAAAESVTPAEPTAAPGPDDGTDAGGFAEGIF